MPSKYNKGLRGFRWRDLDMNHQKAVSFYAGTRGDFVWYQPCPQETARLYSCMDEAGERIDKCKRERDEYTACIERSGTVRLVAFKQLGY